MRSPWNTPSAKRLTVVITISQGTIDNWALATEQLEAALDSLPSAQDIDFKVEFHPGAIIRVPTSRTDEMKASQPIFFGLIPEQIKNGCSVGPRGGDETSSVGPFVIFSLKGSNEDIKCFLTVNQAMEFGTRVDYPASFDAVPTKKWFAGLKSRGEELSEEQERSEILLARNEASKGIGEVICVSDARLDGSQRDVNWALFKLDDQQATYHNKAPSFEKASIKLDHGLIKYNSPLPEERISKIDTSITAIPGSAKQAAQPASQSGP